MSTSMTYSKRKITVTLPVNLLDRLDESVSPRGRSRFIEEAIEARLAIQEQLAVLEDTAGAWQDENHPELDSGDAIDRWVEALRSSWTYIGD